MPSQFFGLNIAASGLRAANAAMNTTANNISNANTDGYSRQTVTQEAADALRVFTTYGCAGAGVDTVAIERIRDEFYDTRYRDNQKLYGEYTQKNYYQSLVEQYLTDNGETGFSTLFSKMQANLQSVMTASGTTTTKATYVASMTSITDYFNTMAINLQNLQNDINQEIKSTCDAINSIAEEVASLNEQINIIEMTGTTANDLRDTRDSLIDDLSEYVSVDVKETDVIDENDPDRDTGATRFEVWIAGGQCLIDTYSYNKLICVARDEDESINQNDIDGLYNIKMARSNYEEGSGKFTGNFDLDNANIGGKLYGLIQMRDGNNQKFFNGTSGVWNYQTHTLTVAVTSDYLKDMAQCALPEQGIIQIGSRTYEYDSWTYDGDSSYTFVLDDTDDETGAAVDFSRIQSKSYETVSIGKSIDYQGIPYYQAQMNEWIRNFSREVNNITTTGFTSTGESGCYMLTGDRTVSTNTSAAQYTFEELSTTNYGYYYLKGDNFAVYSAMEHNADLLATKSDITEGDDEFGNIDKLGDMFNSKEIFRGATSGEFLDKLLADAALNSSNATTMEKTYTALRNTIGNQRLSVSGVDEDEEAANLVKFQNAYTLSSKVVQTLTEMYDQLILNTGV
ncbi:MAG: flagellar hook-associated protein FlgK [Butyrivibrio sp.]|uniref:flagellar hook-associated protein FlgK n=1 Tax=Butyrivibrio sp. TaxID=28121 RepID=UPI0025E66253|nr:flagellar hook-associated protein FlgK [Butyrivibrio sp.]MCR5772526.1 flagellar hook-associated protein FlgK [Butyrivibrio sp.]